MHLFILYCKVVCVLCASNLKESFKTSSPVAVTVCIIVFKFRCVCVMPVDDWGSVGRVGSPQARGLAVQSLMHGPHEQGKWTTNYSQIAFAVMHEWMDGCVIVSLQEYLHTQMHTHSQCFDLAHHHRCTLGSSIVMVLHSSIIVGRLTSSVRLRMSRFKPGLSPISWSLG